MSVRDCFPLLVRCSLLALLAARMLAWPFGQCLWQTRPPIRSSLALLPTRAAKGLAAAAQAWASAHMITPTNTAAATMTANTVVNTS